MVEIEQGKSWDKTAPYYEQLADMLKAIAESYSTVAIDGTTHVRWREVMGLMREVDTHADITTNPSDAILDELQSFTFFRQRYPHLAPEELGERSHNTLLARTRKILKLGQYVAASTTIYRYTRLRAAEAVQTAEIFADTASESVLAQTQFTSSFMPTLRTMGVAACFLDSVHDLPEEYRKGYSNLRPTIAVRARLLGEALYHAGPLVAVGPHVPVIRETLRAARLQYERKHAK